MLQLGGGSWGQLVLLRRTLLALVEVRASLERLIILVLG
jgi:hypothetical protein